MKIHKKILLHYQSCDSPVDKEGYLYKKGVRNSSYQKRWFVLKGNLLFYKERRAERELLGVLVLEGCSVQLCESDERFAFSVVWSESHVAGGRVYKLAAEDQSTQESWLKALLSANHAYLQLLLMDLEARYRELGGTSHPVPLKPAPYAPPGATASSYTAKQLLPAPPVPHNAAIRKSPKLWPKRNANVAPISGPAPPQREWLEFGLGHQEEFIELHTEFGKEVMELIAERLRRGREGEEEEEEEAEADLIDFG
ncbi:sesquipedalian-1-like [Gadus macrocephalus]|uniref:sesquipedalian-1-like n=1 Tax=Gadus macrocephalus TaxID=80720 RepID=UPI0028CB2442|nr:sesquipedalian-1-like [Gadus macrocephalus]XP_059892834.1 sesquipedalian-1-like [Gadus macrocephalus]XP_059892835.1 sesquipedalian-1-like [Gadus macrocephalus]XP_059892836.1 sesquipedalian-1-like [Gadus macrocephalus]